MKIRELNISARTKSCLLNAGYETVDELMNASLDDLLSMRNLGKAGANEICSLLEAFKAADSEEDAEEISQEINEMEDETDSVEYAIIETTATTSALTTSDEKEFHLGLHVLNLSMRTVDCLHRMGIYNIGDLCSLSEIELKQNRFMGYSNRREIVNALAERGWKLKD